LNWPPQTEINTTPRLTFDLFHFRQAFVTLCNMRKHVCGNNKRGKRIVAKSCKLHAQWAAYPPPPFHPDKQSTKGHCHWSVFSFPYRLSFSFLCTPLCMANSCIMRLTKFLIVLQRYAKSGRAWEWQKDWNKMRGR